MTAESAAAAAGGLSWKRAVELAGTDREQLAAELRHLDPIDAAIEEAGWITRRGPQHRRTVVRDGWLTWSWEIVDLAVSPHPVLASGTALTQSSAWRRLERAYGRLLDGAR